MGCWNATCGISRLPIIAGDPVYACLITSSGDADTANSFCYIDGMYSPISLPMVAQYNDYGSIEKIQPSFVTELMSRTFGFKDTEKWLHDSIQENTVSVKDYKGTSFKAGLWMVRKDVVDAFHNKGFKVEYFDGKRFVHRNSIELFDEHAEAFYAAYVSKKDRIVEIFEKGDPLEKLLSKGYCNNRNVVKYCFHSNSEYGITSDNFEIYLDYLKWLVYKDYEYTSPEVQEFFSIVKIHFKIKGILQHCRIAYAPQEGAGSQHSELNGYVNLTSATNMAIKNIKAKFKAWS